MLTDDKTHDIHRDSITIGLHQAELPSDVILNKKSFTGDVPTRRLIIIISTDKRIPERFNVKSLIIESRFESSNYLLFKINLQPSKTN